jgi:hypothetical protein
MKQRPADYTICFYLSSFLPGALNDLSLCTIFR